jgi:4-amino-4-deoxy-L-arabinose transferase-like glycosyltransferase
MSFLQPGAEPRRYLTFLSIGLLNTGVSAVVFLLLLHAGVDVSLAAAAGFAAGAATSYALNRTYTFGDLDRRHAITATRWLVVAALGLAATAFLVRIVVRGFGVPALPGQVLVAASVSTLTFKLSRRWAFDAEARWLPRIRPELGALLAGTAVINLWALGQNGWANDYYSAAVRSMSSSWHNFVFASFDPSGVMTVDKPPLALWVQTISAKAFGFHSLSILVPQALMGVGAVWLVYDLVARRWGRVAGAIGGVVLATTPIAVAMARHNNPDELLVLLSTAAVWCTGRAIESGRVRWTVLAGLCVGLGFETKMAAALLVVPALAAAVVWAVPRGRLKHLAGGGAAMLVSGGAWPLLVALTPASDRPWISGTSDNSIWSLITSYNGLGRLDGQSGGPQQLGGGGGGGGLFGGATGPFRLLNDALGPQAGWLLGFAVVAGVGILVATRLRRRDLRTGWLIAVGGAWLTIAVAFSTAKGIFHPYYVAQLAPFTAALVGGGAGEMLEGKRAARVLAPVAVVFGVAIELVLLNHNSEVLAWLPIPLVVLGAIAAFALSQPLRARARRAATIAATALLLVAPATWAADTLGHATQGTFPAGGPASAATGGGFGAAPPGGGAAPGGAFRGAPPGGGAAPSGPGGGFGGDASLTSLLSYTRSHGGGTVAVSSQSGAAGSIISSGADVAGIGGFSGRESQVSLSWLMQRVRSGEIRWIVIGPNSGGPPGMQSSNTALTAWVKQHGTAITSVSKSGGTLYRLSGRVDAVHG